MPTRVIGRGVRPIQQDLTECQAENHALISARTGAAYVFIASMMDSRELGERNGGPNKRSRASDSIRPL